MDIAEDAFHLRRTGQFEKAKSCFLQALDLEARAAYMLSLTPENEPSRSILFRSAASLAYHGGDYDTAERLVSNGLAGFPPEDVRVELKELFDEINFTWHLARSGQTLSDNEWGYELYGEAVANGKIQLDILLGRADRLRALYYRTFERKLNWPYRTSSDVSPALRQSYGLYAKVTPGSFMVTFQVGKPNLQMSLFPELETAPKVEPSEVIEEVIQCMELLEGLEPKKLKERIPDESYYDNFVALSKHLSPDGEDIKGAGLVSNHNGRVRTVSLRKNKVQLTQTTQSNEIILASSEEEKSTLTLSGTLKIANAATDDKFGRVTLIDTDHHKTDIKVPIALMRDIVQPYFDEEVTIQVRKNKKSLILEEIERKK
jgi:hypothetical protein